MRLDVIELAGVGRGGNSRAARRGSKLHATAASNWLCDCLRTQTGRYRARLHAGEGHHLPSHAPIELFPLARSGS